MSSQFSRSLRMVFEEQLIDLVRENAFIYNSTLPSYKNKIQKEIVWAQIARRLGAPVTACKHRWKTLRDRYVGELRRRKHIPGCPPFVETEWAYRDKLKFLNDTVKHRKTEFNYRSRKHSSMATSDLSTPENRSWTAYDDENSSAVDLVVVPKIEQTEDSLSDDAQNSFKNEEEQKCIPPPQAIHFDSTKWRNPFLHFQTARDSVMATPDVDNKSDIDSMFMEIISYKLKQLPVKVRNELEIQILTIVNNELNKITH